RFGSLIIIALMLLYPTLRASELVGTDLVQAVPLVASAAIGYLIFGDFQLGITSALLVGSIPGAYIGAQAFDAAQRSTDPAGAGVRATGLRPEAVGRRHGAHRSAAPRRSSPRGTGVDAAPQTPRLPRSAAPRGSRPGGAARPRGGLGTRRLRRRIRSAAVTSSTVAVLLRRQLTDPGIVTRRLVPRFR